MVVAVRGVGDAFYYPALVTYRLALDVQHAVTGLRRIVIPAMIAAKIAWIPRHLARLEAEVASLPRTVPRIIINDIPAHVKPIAAKIVHEAVAIPWPRIRTVEREAGALGKRIDSLAKRLTVPLGLAAVGVALSTLGLGWTRCSRVKKVGKQVCGIDDSLLDALLADALLVVGTISLVEFAEGLQAGIGDVVPQIQKFWQAD
jgi:hypothetical protein